MARVEPVVGELIGKLLGDALSDRELDELKDLLETGDAATCGSWILAHCPGYPVTITLATDMVIEHTTHVLAAEFAWPENAGPDPLPTTNPGLADGMTGNGWPRSRNSSENPQHATRPCGRDISKRTVPPG